jgi:hypothetical protein
MKKTIIGSVLILAYVNLVPYACRLWRGLDWVAQYFPFTAEGPILITLLGVILLVAFASLPAIPLSAAFLLRKWIPITFFLSIIVATTLLGFWHHDYDLASDAQAAIGLFFIPIYTTMLTSVIAGISGTIEYLVRRNRKEG